MAQKKQHGEDAARAKLSDGEVARIRYLRSQDAVFWTYARLARTFEVSKTLIIYIITERRRIYG